MGGEILRKLSWYHANRFALVDENSGKEENDA